MLVKCGSVDITNKVLSLTKKGAFADHKFIGQVPSFQLDLKLDNRDEFFDDKLNEIFYYAENSSSKEYVYIAYEKPEKYTKELSLKLYDRSYELDVPFLTELNYTENDITIGMQLDEMERLTGFIFNRDNIPEFVLNRIVKWYDNTITCRSYLSMIAELFGANVFGVNINTFAFIQIDKKEKHKTSMVSNFEKGELYHLTRVCFDNSVIKAEKGSVEGNTIFLSPNNFYIEDDNKEEIVNYIYSILNGLSVVSLTKFSTKNIESLNLGDIINYNDEFNVMILDISSKVISANSFVQELQGEMVSKNEEMQINKISPTTKIRLLKVEFDQEKLKWGVTAEQVEGNTQKITSLELSNEEISMRIEQTYTKGETNVQIENVIQQTANELNFSIGKIEENNEKLKNEFNDLSLTVDGLTNRLTTTGGNNLLLNSMGVYGDGWTGEWLIDKSQEVKQRNIYGFAILLKNSILHQSVSVPNGSYTLSFSYKKHISLANVTIVINNEEYVLSSEEWTQVKLNFEIESGSFEISFNSDTEQSCTICNLMLNQGTEAMIWSLNANETWSDMMRMSSSGLEIDAAQSDVLFNAKADIIGFKNKNTKEYVAIFTDTGAEMNEIVIKKKARIVGILFQSINGHTALNYVGGDD